MEKDSILDSIKKLLGISAEDTNFDTDVIMNINSALAVLTQLGVGPSTGFSISDSSSTWSELISDNKRLEMVKTYVYLKAKIVFDPPLSSTVMEAMNQRISELEWRIVVAAESTS